MFKSVDDLPKTLGNIQKGDVIAWDYSLFELDYGDQEVHASSESLHYGEQGRLRLNVSSMRTVRVILNRKKIQVPELKVRETHSPHVESVVAQFSGGLYGKVGQI